MLEFCYELDYKSLDFTDPETHELYRIGRGEQGVLLSTAYRRHLCSLAVPNSDVAVKSANKIYAMYLDYRDAKDFVGMDMCRKFLEMDLLVLVDMLTIIVERSMIVKVKSALRNLITGPVTIIRVLRSLRKYATSWQTMQNTNESDNTGDEKLSVPTNSELLHLQLQAILRENDMPPSEIKYLGKRDDGEHWYLIAGEQEVPVIVIVGVDPVE